MAYNQNSQKALENLLNEFFNNDTGNARKREIENILSTFSQQNDAWKHCLYYLDHTHNSYVSMFCLTTLENIINKQWNGLLPECQTEICTALYGFIVDNHKVVPVFIRNKLIKLVVDIARLSWPHFYPEFFVNIFSLARTNETIILCITFLQTISEELIHSKEELLFVRKVELKRLLSQQIPTIFSILSGFLDNIIEKNRNAVTSTPPPSPTQGNHSPSPSASVLGSDISSFSTGCSVFQVFEKDCGKGKQWVTLPPLDPDSETIAALSLNCLTQYFSWIPLSSVMTPQLLNTIFIFASLGVDPQHNKHSFNGSSSIPNSNNEINRFFSSSLSILAMNAINEILSKNYVPQNFEEFLLETFRNTFHLLQKLTNRERGRPLLELLEPNYLDKFSEFLRLFVSLHLRRFESNAQFPILEFLALLFRYTFSQPNVDSYCCCLEVWSTFLDHLLSKGGPEENEHYIRYEEALMSLSRGILEKIQFKHNQEELDDLEHDLPEEGSRDEDVDSLYGDLLDGEVTEWQGFFNHNIELLAKVADLFPDKIFSLLYELFLDSSKMYLSIDASAVLRRSESPGDCSIDNGLVNMPPSKECLKLHFMLRDMSSSLQSIGRLSMMFLGESLSKRSSTALLVFQKLIELAKFSNGMKFYKVEHSLLRQDFIEVYAQILSTMRVWTYWLSQLYGQQFVQVYPGGVQAHQYQDICHSINKQMLIIAADAVSLKGPYLIVNCGIQLLSSLSVLVRSPVALELHQIENLYSTVSTKSLEYKTLNGICCALVNFLLLPWPSFITDHKLEARKQLLASLILSLKKEFLQIDVSALASNKSLLETNSSVIQETLSLICCQIDELNGTDKFTREIYYECIQDVIRLSIRLFPLYISHSDVCESILSLTVMSVQVFRMQMGPSQVVETVQSFLNIFTSNQQLYLAVSESQPTAIKVMEKFLKLLELITTEPGQSFKHFIPNIISLCMDHVFPVVVDKQTPEIKISLFKLLHSLLDYNWKYFFRAGVKSLGSASWDTCENEGQFTQIIQAFGQSLMQSDITILKLNLESLEALNSKYKLYHKGIIKRNLLGQFITVLFQILLNRTHDLLQDEITLTIYNMASVDFESFFCAFLSHFLHDARGGMSNDQMQSLKETFKMETDLPSFTQHLHRFVNDLRYYGMLNASFPPRGNRIV